MFETIYPSVGHFLFIFFFSSFKMKQTNKFTNPYAVGSFRNLGHICFVKLYVIRIVVKDDQC